MDHTEYSEFMRMLPAAYKNKVVSAEKLAVMWLEARTEREMQLYPQLVNATHKIIETGFSEQVITPGVTTTADVEWWFRQKIRDSGYDTWFHPTVSIQRNEPWQRTPSKTFAARPKDNVIVPGDLLHVDIGISYLRLNTDVQQHAYVLKPGEKDVPDSLKAAFAKGNRLQDILTSHFKQGRTGNQILAAALAQAKAEGIVADDLHPSAGFARTRGRTDDRHVGHAGRRAGQRRFPDALQDGLLDRTQCRIGRRRTGARKSASCLKRTATSMNQASATSMDGKSRFT